MRIKGQKKRKKLEILKKEYNKPVARHYEGKWESEGDKKIKRTTLLMSNVATTVCYFYAAKISWAILLLPPPFFLVLFEVQFLYCPMQMPFVQYCGEADYFFGDLYKIKKANYCTRCLDKILKAFACAIKLLFKWYTSIIVCCWQYPPISVALFYKARVFTIWWSEVTNHIL